MHCRHMEKKKKKKRESSLKESIRKIRSRGVSLHDDAAAALVVAIRLLVAIALSLLRVSIGAALRHTAVRLLVEAADLSYKVVKCLVHIDPLLGRSLNQSRSKLLCQLASLYRSLEFVENKGCMLVSKQNIMRVISSKDRNIIQDDAMRKKNYKRVKNTIEREAYRGWRPGARARDRTCWRRG